ncbi:MAG: NUDIX domain-containing protein [Brachymonas sp.]|nr:NUDIX domain-containing protein [Brachymonas sp.]
MTNHILQADGHLPRHDAASPQDPRKIVDVAVGILLQTDGRFLMTTRPEGKVYAGYWEFPGGKIERGETLEAALRRELQEEIGITIGAAHPWKEQIVDYPHALVRLHFCKVKVWQGTFEMREGQHMQWQQLPPSVSYLAGSDPCVGMACRRTAVSQ